MHLISLGIHFLRVWSRLNPSVFGKCLYPLFCDSLSGPPLEFFCQTVPPALKTLSEDWWLAPALYPNHRTQIRC